MSKEFSTSLGYYIHEIAKKSTIKFNQEFENLGITYSQFRVLNCLWKKGGLTQKEIHELISVKPSTLTGIIDILVKKSLVLRKSDKSDARVKRIYLTEKGESLKTESWNIINKFDVKVDDVLSKEEQALMRKWLKILLENI